MEELKRFKLHEMTEEAKALKKLSEKVSDSIEAIESMEDRAKVLISQMVYLLINLKNPQEAYDYITCMVRGILNEPDLAELANRPAHELKISDPPLPN